MGEFRHMNRSADDQQKQESSHPGAEFSSLARRSFYAVLLTAGFYLLAIMMVALLLFVPYAEMAYAGRIHIQIVVFCFIGAGVILWSIIPRPDRFKAPGPRLLQEDQPELFELLNEVAAEMRQEMPAEVYAIGELNAWVMDRGGLMGIGSRRVMGLGIPLLQVLNTAQARGVIAHEFGHFYSGDTRLGPWIYKTRSAMMRTLEALAGHSSLLQKPFIWYGNAFMRVTQSISQYQEFTADRMAAGIGGSQAMIDALRVIYGAGELYDIYWRNEYAPALDKGYRPPLAGGFALFLHAPTISATVDRIIEDTMESAETTLYDSHPSLRDRVAALQQLDVRKEQDNTPAISLLRNLDKLEESFLVAITGPEAVRKITPISWEQAGSHVWLPIWRELVETHRQRLEGLRLHDLPAILSGPETRRNFLRGMPEADLDEQHRFLEGLIGAAIVLLLVRMGWHLTATPGEDVRLSWQGLDVFPFVAVRKMIAGEETADTLGELLIVVTEDAYLATV